MTADPLLAPILSELEGDFASQEFRSRPRLLDRRRFWLFVTLTQTPLAFNYVQGQLVLAGFDVDTWLRDMMWSASLCSGLRWRWDPDAGMRPIDERKTPNGKPVGRRSGGRGRR